MSEHILADTLSSLRDRRISDRRIPVPREIVPADCTIGGVLRRSDIERRAALPLPAEIDRLRAELTEMTRIRNLNEADAARHWNEAGRLRAVNAELLVALQAIVDDDTTYPPNYNTMTPLEQERWILYGRSALIARAAIAKAKGFE